jgi:hypothetical protein
VQTIRALTSAQSASGLKHAESLNDALQVSPLSEWLVSLGLFLYLVVPGNFLVSLGIPYSLPGGSVLVKLHPGSYLILLAFVLTILRGQPIDNLARLFRQSHWLVLYVAIVISTLLFTIARFGMDGLGFFFDTLLIPALLAAVLICMAPQNQRWMFYLIVMMTVINAILGIFESNQQWRLIPFLIEGTPAVEPFFRATAMASHPLESAQRTLAVMFAACVLPWRWRVPVVLILLLSLLAFGSRGALGTAIILLAVSLAAFGALTLIAGKIDMRWLVEVFGALIFSSLLLSAVVGYLEMGTGLFNKLYWDASAQSRLEAISLIGELNLNDLLLGIGSEGVVNLTEARGGWFNIENFWIVLMLKVGLCLFIPLAIALLGFYAGVASRGPVFVRMAAFAFLLAASGNNALSSKTPNLSIVVATLIGATAVHLNPSRSKATIQDGSRIPSTRLEPICRQAKTTPLLPPPEGRVQINRDSGRPLTSPAMALARLQGRSIVNQDDQNP